VSTSRIISVTVAVAASLIAVPALAHAGDAGPSVRTSVHCEGSTTVRNLVLVNRGSARAVTFRIRNSRPAGHTLRSSVVVPAGESKVRRVRVRHQGWVADVGVRAAGQVLLDTVVVGRCG
jgi:hypothetical protein